VLIFFVAIAAANTLVMTTSARRAEFTLLRRIGATRKQLTSMMAVESLFVMVTAVVIGTLAGVRSAGRGGRAHRRDRDGCAGPAGERSSRLNRRRA